MRPPRSPLVLALALAVFGLAAPGARALPLAYTLQLVQSGRDFPTTIRFAPDGRLF